MALGVLLGSCLAGRGGEGPHRDHAAQSDTARAYLVESIPTGMDDLRGTPGVHYTEDVLVRLIRQAEKTIDLTAMYWNLVPRGREDASFGEQRLASLGVGHGKALLEALGRAARRQVRIRIVQARPRPGAPSQESAQLAAGSSNVEIRSVTMSDWYGGGVMHQKMWVFDRRHVYVGSANMDWKSISQVKEMGIVVENQAELAADVTRYFDAWWRFCAMEPDPTEVFDPASQVRRMVPLWSPLVPAHRRKASPFSDLRTRFNLEHPLRLHLNGRQGGVFVTGCPQEVCAPGRTVDGDALVHTILDARESVCISVMDFAPVSLYHKLPDQKTENPIWWPDLIDALLHVLLTKGVRVRLLVSKWAHTRPVILPLLRGLQRTADAYPQDPTRPSTRGRFEIRVFVVPGYDETTGDAPEYPQHTRVNHAKYIVTDRRANIGTSNMTWGYFKTTAGSSFNTDHPDIVQELQYVFDRDWSSHYAKSLDAVR